MTKEQQRILDEINEMPEQVNKTRLIALVIGEKLRFGKPVQISEEEWVIGASKYTEVKH